MDSITQVALGSAVGIAVMGRRSSPWKAAIWGGLCGTLPDLDVVIDHGDAIRNMTFHRAESHSLFYLSLASVPLAWLVSRFRSGAGFGRWWFATWLALVTHPLLDWLTIYGTQLALPFSDHPFAVGSVFVVDPIYTLLLFAGIIGALMADRRSPGEGRHRNLIGLGLATAYLAWGAAAQVHVTSLARVSLPQPVAQTGRLLVVPTPFNTVLWRVLVMDGDSYLEGYYSLLDSESRITFNRHPAQKALREHAADVWFVDRIAWFSHGFFRMRRENGMLTISDLRMGQEPGYTFTFALPESAPGTGPRDAPVLLPQRIEWEPSLQWLWRRMLGERLPYPGT